MEGKRGKREEREKRNENGRKRRWEKVRNQRRKIEDGSERGKKAERTGRWEEDKRFVTGNIRY